MTKIPFEGARKFAKFKAARKSYHLHYLNTLLNNGQTPTVAIEFLPPFTKSCQLDSDAIWVMVEDWQSFEDCQS
jgi:hypothetical protein